MTLSLDAIGKKIGPVSSAYDWKDIVLYALGVGAGFDELAYVYESKLKVIPSFAVTSMFPECWGWVWWRGGVGGRW